MISRCLFGYFTLLYQIKSGRMTVNYEKIGLLKGAAGFIQKNLNNTDRRQDSNRMSPECKYNSYVPPRPLIFYICRVFCFIVRKDL